MTVTVAIDCMGGDHGPVVTVPAALELLRQQGDVQVILVGLEDRIRVLLAEADESRISIRHASEVVGMDEMPSLALRNKKDSSMRVAINLVKEGKADACVSAGNTGALMAISRFVLKTLPGIDRPAICAIMPTISPPSVGPSAGASTSARIRSPGLCTWQVAQEKLSWPRRV